MQLPANTEAADAAFLTSALREGGVLDSSSAVAEVGHEPIGVGVGIVGQLARLSLRYDGDAPGAPGSVVIKLPSQYPENRAVGDHFNFYEREGRFYQQLGDKVPVRTPTCFWNRVDPTSGEFGLVMEDLGSRTSISQVAGVGRDRARQAAVSLAGLHAELWESPVLDGLGWMPFGDDPINLNAGQGYRDAWPLFVERMDGVLPPAAFALGERIKESFETVMHANQRSAPVTVFHGDFRIDNLLFDDDAEPAERVAVLDWQIAGKGGGVFDVAYLLSGSMEVEERRASELDILREWHDALGRTDYTMGHAFDGYRRSTLITTVYAVIPAAQMDPANDRGRELIEGMAQRSFAACLDLDSGDLLP